MTNTRELEEELVQVLMRHRHRLTVTARTADTVAVCIDGTRARIVRLEATLSQIRNGKPPRASAPTLETLEPALPDQRDDAELPPPRRDPDGAISWNDLLSERELQQIEQRTTLPTYSLRSWDRWDFMVVGGAGIVAALYDIFAVAIPRDIVYLGEHVQRAGITPWLKRVTDVPNDNPLARWFKVPYDDMSVPGMNPRDHRLQALGHDPVLGFLVGVWDILHGQMHMFDRVGGFHVVEGLKHAQTNPLTALVVFLGHLLSDAFTKQGVPPPGFGLLHGLQAGSFGKRGRTVGDLVRWMYLNGYDLRHFAVQAGSPAVVELVIRGYALLRTYLAHDDQDSDPIVAAGAEAKLDSMLVWGHAIASIANAGKVCVLVGNPLAINYAQWLAFIGRLAKTAASAAQSSPVDDLEVMTRRTFNAWRQMNATNLS